MSEDKANITTSRNDSEQPPWSATLHTVHHGDWYGYGETEQQAIRDAKNNYQQTMRVLQGKPISQEILKNTKRIIEYFRLHHYKKDAADHPLIAEDIDRDSEEVLNRIYSLFESLLFELNMRTDYREEAIIMGLLDDFQQMLHKYE